MDDPTTGVRETTRRDWLRVAGVTGVASVAGCVESPIPGGDETSSDGPDQSAEPTASASQSATATDATSETTATEIHADYETTQIVARTPDGERLGALTAAIADTPELRSLGLSDTPSMPDDRGMLFVYDEVGDHTFVMRRMSFGLDIVYADDEGVVTRVHHAEQPGPDEDGEQQRYPGRGRYVLEVNIDWTTERGVSEGDVLDFSL